MDGKFIILNDNKLCEYNNYKDIPLEFDHLISFEPKVIPGPHTKEEHKEMGTLSNMLSSLMKRER